MKLGNWLKTYRNNNGLSMQDMANKCGFSKAYIGQLEKGVNPSTNKPISPTIQTLSKIANAVGIEVDDFMKILDDDQPVIIQPEISTITSKEAFSERLRTAMTKANMKAVELHEKTGISKASISEYLSGNYEPKQRNTYKIAQALNVTPSYLMGVAEITTPAQPLPPLTPRDERDIQKKLKEMLDDMAPDTGLAYYNGEEPLDDETRELIRASLENSLRMAKQIAKAKYTPKKYQKE